MSKRRNPPSTADGYPGLRSKRPKLAPLLPQERDYLSLPTTDSLPLPPVKQQQHHRYDLRVRPPRPPNPPVNGHRQRNGEASLRELEAGGRWRNAHSYSINYQQKQQRLSSTQKRHVERPDRSRQRHFQLNENDLVCIISGNGLYVGNVILCTVEPLIKDTFHELMYLPI